MAVWGFYRRVWKNIFYERGDKERKEGFWRDGRAKLYFFKIFLGGGREFEILWGNVFLGIMGWGIFGLRRRWDDIWNIP